ncbi:MAG: hypothetical protein V4714_04320 [Bacteroidota bacterium]
MEKNNFLIRIKIILLIILLQGCNEDNSQYLIFNYKDCSFRINGDNTYLIQKTLLYKDTTSKEDLLYIELQQGKSSLKSIQVCNLDFLTYNSHIQRIDKAKNYKLKVVFIDYDNGNQAYNFEIHSYQWKKNQVLSVKPLKQ